MQFFLYNLYIYEYILYKLQTRLSTIINYKHETNALAYTCKAGIFPTNSNSCPTSCTMQLVPSSTVALAQLDKNAGVIYLLCPWRVGAQGKY